MVPIDPDPQELTSYVMGELPPEECADFEAVLRGDADLRGKVNDTAEVVGALSNELRIGPGGLSEDQRNAVLDHLDSVVSGEVAAESMERDPVGGARPDVLKSRAPNRSAYFSPKKAFNAAAIAAGIILVVGGAFFLGMQNPDLGEQLTTSKGIDLKNGIESYPMVAGVEENGYEMRVRLSLPDETENLLMVGSDSNVDVIREEASWNAWVDALTATADGSMEAEVGPEVIAVADNEAVSAEPPMPAGRETLVAEVESAGFRETKDHGVSAVPVVADSDFYQTLWTNVRRESRLPAKEVVEVEQLVNYFPYNYPAPAYGEPLSVSVETGECPWNPRHALVRIGIRGKDVIGGGSGEVVASDLGVVADFNSKIVKSYRLIGYSRCSQDATVGKVIHDSETGADLRSNQTVTALYEVVPLQLDELDLERDLDRRGDLKERGVHHPVGLHAGIFEREDKSRDLLSVRLIYRIPGTLQHNKEVVSVPPVMKLWSSLDEDFRFAAVVAGFGLRLKGDLSADRLEYEHVEQLAKQALGRDHDGRRAEFLALVKQVKSLPDCPDLPEEEERDVRVLASPRR